MNESQTHPSLENGRRVERFAHIGHALNQTQIARPEFRKIPKLPPIQRTSMAPRALQRRVWPRILRALSGRRSRLQTRPAAWRIQAAQRRVGLAMLVVCQTALATWSLTRTFPSADLTFLQLAILAVFAVLFSWISFSFWSNVAGFAALWGKTKIADASTLRAGAGKALCGRTAVLMPICEEDARRCFRAIEAMCRSLHRTGESDKFDFFVLSDTSTAKRRFEEESEWLRTCRALRGLGRIYYRRRRVNIKRKSGNVADFLRRWSRPYEYMIVLDADSIMTGEAIVSLARTMEAMPQLGILQTTPTIVNGESLFARVQQFASRVYGPLFSAGLHHWQLGESYYWGHNAIIRIAPFVHHCGLARLPGSAPLGGEILSHDFVEAALMGRAGYEVRLALDLPGSYEESPPSLLDELKRDRRWCQGNLQHFRLLFAEGIKTGHRAILAMGIMAYASALLWAVFLLLTSIELTVETLVVPDYFPGKQSLFPTWPKWNPEWAIALASTTALLLFVPKFLSFLLVVKWGAAARFGGAGRLAISILLEILVSTLLAPTRMWFHAKFVLVTIFGRQIKWNAQKRGDAAISWREAAWAHGPATLAGAVWILAVYWFSPSAFFWLLPVAIPLLLSIPLSGISSSAVTGNALRRSGLLTIPEDSFPPAVLEDLRKLTAIEAECAPRLDSAPCHADRYDRLVQLSVVPSPDHSNSSAPSHSEPSTSDL